MYMSSGPQYGGPTAHKGRYRRTNHHKAHRHRQVWTSDDTYWDDGCCSDNSDCCLCLALNCQTPDDCSGCCDLDIICKPCTAPCSAADDSGCCSSCCDSLLRIPADMCDFLGQLFGSCGDVCSSCCDGLGQVDCDCLSGCGDCTAAAVHGLVAARRRGRDELDALFFDGRSPASGAGSPASVLHLAILALPSRVAGDWPCVYPQAIVRVTASAMRTLSGACVTFITAKTRDALARAGRAAAAAVLAHHLGAAPLAVVPGGLSALQLAVVSEAGPRVVRLRARLPPPQHSLQLAAWTTNAEPQDDDNAIGGPVPFEFEPDAPSPAELSLDTHTLPSPPLLLLPPPPPPPSSPPTAAVFPTVRLQPMRTVGLRRKAARLLTATLARSGSASPTAPAKRRRTPDSGSTPPRKRRQPSSPPVSPPSPVITVTRKADGRLFVSG
ncbi:uncharacterized protein AMSG_03027 [Thecamonas trahens ATCC 50062]|uniref:Uncharacterized protein n=1 Tax=Thecamonas trahens ATCC 50062 TaxID=461836 RepID=A0A0L0D356_THETB|nr:hypothetical protein AMSG_03027 [Thecamonas trahens ATCC 50062]KNC46590.1 hypothetical protein AMSG_03027 [Thecamonas trahens ATCC 50062]|eukprot:XP_013760365.1 hypothetical protein AMSG_03027 [Thecamonas trahens ATCC 50062]